MIPEKFVKIITEDFVSNDTLGNVFERSTELDNVERISGTQIAGNPYEAVEKIADTFMNTQLDEHSLRNLNTFEEVMVGTFLQKFHLMRYKQKKYGKMNISEAGLPGLVTRMRDKFERAKNMVGDPSTQIADVKKIILDTPEDATPKELMDALDAIWTKVNPQEDSEESLTDTAIDIGNYGDIFYMVLTGAWGKPMLDD
jgi:hypothetical protein